MFYVQLMDIAKLVQKTLTPNEKCIQAIECARILDGKRTLRYAAIVINKQEHGVFIFTALRVPCLQSSDLVLESVIPIDGSMRCSAEAPSQQTELRLSLRSPIINVLIEMPKSDPSTLFLAEIKKAKDVYSQVPAFGEPAAIFPWLEKYKRQSTDFNQSSGENPFAEDIFDPLKHMSLDGTNMHVVDTESSRQTTWFQDDMSSLSSSYEHLKPAQKSRSRDSLDKILGGDEDYTDSMETLQWSLGISSGNELPILGKTISSREKIVKKFLTDRELEFTDQHSFRIYCGTWNVNGQSPPDSLHKWMVVDAEPPDIYVVGFQELDLSKEAFIFTDSPKEVEWQKAVKAALHPKAKYLKVKSIRLVGIMLIVYIQAKHKGFIKFIDSDSVPTGIMGIMGNKGGVSVRFTLHNTSLCFVTSHLAAHQDEYERRNQDYKDIMSKTKFKDFSPPLEISEHDIVFWIGDLNYRIDLPIDTVKSYIKKGAHKKLILEDQLYRQLQANSEIFRGFEEGFPNFDPTYKFDSGTDNYDSSEKNRVPAYCDRILWRGPGVKQLRYDSHPQLKISDHKPVSSLFDVGIRVLDDKRFKRVYEDIMKKLDRLENDHLPQIKIDNTELIFKDVKFVEPQVQVVTVANVGQIPVEFEFINKLDDQTYCRPWLKATPCKSIIEAGVCCEVQIEVYVDKSTAAKLNSGEEKLEDILVLHLTNGKDSFITVSGNYMTSSFGSSIEALIQMHGPIREVPVAELIEIEQPGSLSRVDITKDGGRLYMVPKEIWKMVDFLHKYAMNKDELFQQPGRNSEIQFIRDCLDTGRPEHIPDSLSVHSVAEAFLMFLESLPQPVIPYEFYTKCLSTSNNLLLSKQLVTSLPGCHKNTFLYICAFLRELLKHSDKNGLDIKFLCSFFGEVMLRPQTPLFTTASAKEAVVKERRSKLREEDAKKAAFMYHFLSNEIEL
ncbi:inositol polyphosphate 5-phosphatase OCRL-like [Biomphalaria glabrata]|uniref:phosphoinositide 5-phosphatase n=1 Tax=Biomphalaria glabrata TaxID=6526 RepID=A0A9W3AKW2_BIOGL|nr:inositol polyphosphate 5-phosphatase OCRL-like [Biomphalaria glabrata]XP_055887833.1 inositol polyphosphate 5-phosphatase OCRL-like [Biomphalaria glabrata]XP_055887834.1 inositol polyphosphate 5-phosphatase OCRL-like [Biomphalaria glabrata]